MRNSPNLSIIIKALDKISGRLARDFGEIENLQTNHFSATKFTNSCYSRIKENLAQDLNKIHPNYGLEFSDGQKFGDPNAEYTYYICPIDGLINLSRSIPAFSTFIGLEHNNAGKKEMIACAISNVAGNELYWCEKGSGAYLNNRRIRVSSRAAGDNSLLAVGSAELIANFEQAKFNIRMNNCASLDIGYLASGRLDLCLFKASDERFLSPLLLLLKEAGGIVANKNGVLSASNGKINLN